MTTVLADVCGGKREPPSPEKQPRPVHRRPQPGSACPRPQRLWNQASLAGLALGQCFRLFSGIPLAAQKRSGSRQCKLAPTAVSALRVCRLAFPLV